MSVLATVTIHGDVVEVSHCSDGGVGVPLGRLCAILGLTPAKERARIEAAAWGRLEGDTLPSEVIPQWAASARVTRRYAAKLAAWQTDAAWIIDAVMRPPVRVLTITSELVRFDSHGRPRAVPGSRQSLDLEDLAAAVAKHLAAHDIEQRMARLQRETDRQARALRS